MSLEFKSQYFARGEFAKFKFCLSLDFNKPYNDSLHKINSKIKVR